MIIVFLIAADAYGQAAREFNWIPSGNLDVGNLKSENGSSYRSVGDIVRSDIIYPDGTRAGDQTCRRTMEEAFIAAAIYE